MKKVIVFILALTMIFSASSVSFAADSYTEYFSEEREFSVNDDTYNGSTYFYSDEETGYLYSRNVDTEEIKLIYAQNVTEHYLWGENLFCVVNGKNIVKITVTGQNPQTILTTTKDIDQLYVNDDIIFYLMDNSIYRYHITSEITDTISHDTNIFFFYPYSNMAVEYGNITNDGAQEIKQCNSRTRSATLLDNYTFLINTTGTAANTTYYIHGTPVPYSPYYHNKYFNSSINDPCPCHEGSSYCSNVSTCNSCLKVNGSYQCAAFAHTVHKKIWNSYGTRNDRYYDIHTAALAREVFWNIPSGTNVRVAVRGNYTNNNLPNDNIIAQDSFNKHSFIVTNVSEAGVTVYEANWPGACQIKHVTLSFSELAERYIDVCWTFDTSHSFGSVYGRSSSAHWKICTHSNCNGKTAFGYHTYATNNQGITSCTVCGYINSTSINSVENNYEQ